MKKLSETEDDHGVMFFTSICKLLTTTACYCRIQTPLQNSVAPTVMIVNRGAIPNTANVTTPSGMYLSPLRDELRGVELGDNTL